MIFAKNHVKLTHFKFLNRLLRKKCCCIDQNQAEISVSNVVTVPEIEMISECPTQLENIEALPSITIQCFPLILRSTNSQIYINF